MKYHRCCSNLNIELRAGRQFLDITDSIDNIGQFLNVM
jgi:hypothetical protein